MTNIPLPFVAITCAVLLASGCDGCRDSSIVSRRSEASDAGARLDIGPEPHDVAPAWLRAHLPELKLPRATHTRRPEPGPHVLITPLSVIVDGKLIANVADLLVESSVVKVDAVFNELKPLRERFKAEHPGEEFPGAINYWIDGRVRALVVKSVFQTAAFAGYPNAAFIVRADSPDTYAALPADAAVPRRDDGIPPELIQRVVQANRSRIAACYELGLRRKPGLTGKVVMHFTIDARGRATKITAENVTLRDQGVVACIINVFSRMSFPEPKAGRPAIVKYPFRFEPNQSQ